MPHDWLQAIHQSESVTRLRDHLAAGRGVVATNARGSSVPLIAGSVASRTGRPVLLVVAHLDEADDAVDDLELLTEAGHALIGQRFGALEVLPGETSVNLELLAERLDVVQSLALHPRRTGVPPVNPPKADPNGHNPAGDGRDAGPTVLVAPIQALMQGVPRPESLDLFTLEIKPGDDLPPGRLLDWLDRSGYRRVDAIDEPGDFAVRGGIVDLYPPAGHAADPAGTAAPIGPVRVDFFGDEVDTLHRIADDGVGSGPPLGEVRLIGAGVEKLISTSDSTSLIDLLPDDTLVILHETMELAEQARGYYERLTDARGVWAPNTVFQKLQNFATAELNGYSAGSDPDAARIELPIAPPPNFDQDAKRAVTELAELSADPANAVHVLCDRPAEATRLTELLNELAPGAAEHVQIEVGRLRQGFVWQQETKRRRDEETKDAKADPTSSLRLSVSPSLRLLIPHHHLFHRYQTRRRVRKVVAGASATDAFLDLEPGDYVVHVDHGIARFAGLKTMRRGGSSSEFLTLEFGQKALLHVPVSQIDLIQRYVGGFEGRPPLSVLGGKKWSRQKQQVADAVKDLAAELLRVQAARTTQTGITYPADTPWQHEFEAEFPYQETDDQLAAIAAVKADMREPLPMDRLVCGDVGFGKTEVAVRAAFKAAEYGKQVAVLVPTTVLAEQHERTFRSRMADYPFKVASLSRFKTPMEQRKLLKELSAGRVDIVIGTHRLLSGDVNFADLGLVVVDEEQRFGVEHKNKLLQLRLTADVMTLTATPIPRTLHMAMVGLRDISSLSTAPVDRRAVVTEVIPYDEDRIKQALQRELAREGQVYFVHNRVHNIQTVADDLQKLVPNARIIIGHGQMAPKDLEQVMLTFMRREADILVATTIIESGIDIPTANTMFINRSDHFGLAELHQLRGRVGRSNHRAYCYMLLPPDRTVSEVAAKRLKAIEQYAMLGAGFKIAMRDLEIRGAGNLLGPEQSGHIAAVGYEMYCVMLEQATRKLRGEALLEPAKTHLDLPVPASLPKRYIASDKQRMEVYKRLGSAMDLTTIDAVAEDLTEAFGETPEPAERFVQLAEVRVAAGLLQVTALKLDGPDLIFTTAKPEQIAELLQDAPGRVSVLDDKTVYYRPPANYLEDPGTLLAVLRKLLVRPVREREGAD
jgi:transcription-repair coupling factor (superfamily II helicase)